MQKRDVAALVGLMHADQDGYVDYRSFLRRLAQSPSPHLRFLRRSSGSELPRRRLLGESPYFQVSLKCSSLSIWVVELFFL